MSYLALPPTGGVIAGHIKEQILSRMYDHREGYLNAAKACGISTQRAHTELKTDKVLREHVNVAREAIAEFLAEEIVEVADKADETNAAAIALKVKTRQWLVEKILHRFRPPKQDTASLVYNDNRQVLVTPEKLAELRERLAKLQLEEETHDKQD